MNTPARPCGPEQLACVVCLTEIPVSEDRSSEAVDYVLHFCGTECYAAWHAQRTQLVEPVAPQCAPRHPHEVIPDAAGSGMTPLRIVWQRLVTADGATCARCGATQREIERAVGILKEVFQPLGIEPHWDVIDLDEARFKASPGESNRVWIASKPLEEWLGARVGSSDCCPVCAGAPCRTVEVSGRTFEAVPAHLIIRAALIAAAELMTPSLPASRMEMPA